MTLASIVPNPGLNKSLSGKPSPMKKAGAMSGLYINKGRASGTDYSEIAKGDGSEAL